MAGIEARLDPSRFARIHRGCIVNLERVQDIRPLDGGDACLTLQSGATVRLSRNYRGGLRLRLPA
jgi:DNA-binding LytR/AlgR family response regulator